LVSSGRETIGVSEVNKLSFTTKIFERVLCYFFVQTELVLYSHGSRQSNDERDAF
jgi:hypothetical protein